MRQIMSLAEDVRSWVLASGGPVNPPAGAESLRCAAVRCGGSLPSSLRGVLETFDGMPQAAWSALPNLLRFLPASELRRVSVEFPDLYQDLHSAIIFGDYSLSACLFALEAVPEDGAVYALALAEPTLVAPTLGEFISSILLEPFSIMEWS